jgi:hypothetical protein
MPRCALPIQLTMSATDVIGFAGFGCLLAAIPYVIHARRVRAQWVSRNPEVWAAWAAIPRSERRRIRRALRRGDPPPAEYASAVLPLLEEIDGLWGEVPAANRRAAWKRLTILCLVTFAGALLIAFARPDGEAIGLIVVGYTTTLAVFTGRSIWVGSRRSLARTAQAIAVTRSAVANAPSDAG